MQEGGEFVEKYLKRRGCGYFQELGIGLRIGTGSEIILFCLRG